MADDAWSGWQREVAAAVARHRPLFAERIDEPAEVLRDELAAALGLPAVAADPGLRTEGGTVRRDGLEVTDLSWDCGYGPRTRAWLLRPEGEAAPLPGILALFEHGGVKMLGREKLSDGPGLAAPLAEAAAAHRGGCADGRAWAEELARRGAAVLVHDAFGFGSRRLPVAEASPRTVRAALAQGALARQEGTASAGTAPFGGPLDTEALHAAFEGEAAKVAGVLGTSWAGLLAAEDLLALEVLAALPGVDPARLAAIGMSGGGARAGVLRVLAPRLRATAVVAMMSALPELMATHADAHSWTWLSPGVGALGDWPSVVASWTSRPLLVQFGLEDHLFPRDGMERAHGQIQRRFARFGHEANYTGTFHASGHVFTRRMQDEAIDWILAHA